MIRRFDDLRVWDLLLGTVVLCGVARGWVCVLVVEAGSGSWLEGVEVGD